MPAQIYNILIEQGATFRLRLRWVDSADVSQIPAGAVARMQVRTRFDSEDALLDLTTENGGITIDEPAGEIRVRGEAVATATLPAPAEAVYDLEVESPAGDVDRLIMGKVRISPEVTR